MRRLLLRCSATLLRLTIYALVIAGAVAWWVHTQPKRDGVVPPPSVQSDTKQVYTFPDSTALQWVSYDPATDTLQVLWREGKHAFTYCDVPQGVVDGLLEAESAGSYFAYHIGHNGYEGDYQC